MSVSFLVTRDTKSYQILGRVIAEAAPKTERDPITSSCPSSGLKLLLFQGTDIADELLDLIVSELTLVGRHLTLAVFGDLR